MPYTLEMVKFKKQKGAMRIVPEGGDMFAVEKRRGRQKNLLFIEFVDEQQNDGVDDQFYRGIAIDKEKENIVVLEEIEHIIYVLE